MDPRGILKERVKVITFPKSRVTPKDSQGKELTVCSGQAESQAKLLEPKTRQARRQ